MTRLTRIYPALFVLGLLFAGFVWLQTSTDACNEDGGKFKMQRWWYSCEH